MRGIGYARLFAGVGNVIRALSAGVIPLTVKGASGQTANVFAVESDGGTAYFNVNSAGKTSVGPGGYGGTLNVVSQDAAATIIRAIAHASQSGNYVRLDDSSGANLWSVDASGNVQSRAATANYIDRHAADATGSSLVIRKSRNATLGGHTVVQSGDAVGSVTFQGSDGTTWRSAASIQASVDATPGSSDMPGRLMFSTTPDGSATPSERMRIDSTGRIILGGSAGPAIIVGTGTPESAVTAPVGSLFLRTDGGAGTTLYVKQSGTGNTGWAGK